METQEFGAFFKEVGGNEGTLCHYPTRLDTYGCGCQHNCAYCYARSLLGFRGLWNAASPSVADIDRIRSLVNNRLKPGDIVRLGGMTDCFQPLERQHRVTYETIKALNERHVSYLIVTKSALIAEPEYLDVLRRDLAHIQVSVTSTSDKLSKMMEPGASLPGQRIAAIERLAQEGFDVSVRLSPFIPEFVNVERINAIHCDKILVEFLRVNGFIKRWLNNRGVNTEAYSVRSGGYNHLPLKVKRGLMASLDFPQKSVCEDVPRHWRFWRDNLNANPDDCCNLTRNQAKR